MGPSGPNSHHGFAFIRIACQAPCAWHALGLMGELSDRKIKGTKDSAFRVVTGLLYEAVSGQPDADLKRACDSVLQNVDLRSGTD